MGGVGNVLESDGLRIVLVDVGEHLLEADLPLYLHPCGLMFGQTVKVAEQILKMRLMLRCTANSQHGVCSRRRR